MVTVRDVIEDCRKAAKMYRQEWPRAVSPDSVAMIYERIAGSLERAHAQRALNVPEHLGDPIPVDELVWRLNTRGAELNSDAVTPNGQLMLKAAFYLAALTSTERGDAK